MKKTVTVCDICGTEIADDKKRLEGIVRNGKQEVRFDICEADNKKLFGALTPKPRRGRKPVEA
jgi:hypothetical protein